MRGQKYNRDKRLGKENNNWKPINILDTTINRIIIQSVLVFLSLKERVNIKLKLNKTLFKLHLIPTQIQFINLNYLNCICYWSLENKSGNLAGHPIRSNILLKNTSCVIHKEIHSQTKLLYTLFSVIIFS